MASRSMTGTGSADHIAKLLAYEIQNSGLRCELADSICRSAGNAGIYVMAFEKYYWRASNRASLTVAASGEGDSFCADAVGPGGGQGPIFKFSWGAKEDLIGTAANILSRQGFR